MIKLFGMLSILYYFHYDKFWIIFKQVSYNARSGLEPEDMQVVYNYLVSTLLPAHLEKELHGGSIPRNSPSPFTTSHYGKYGQIYFDLI